MQFRYHPPSKILQPYVQGYLEADDTINFLGGQNTLFPNGFSGIFFNYGYGKLILKNEFTVPPVSIFGQIDQHFTAIHAPGFYSIGVLLKPTVLSKFLQVNMGEFTNNAFNGLLLRKDLKILHERMEDTTSTDQKIVLLDNYFITAFRLVTLEKTITDYALTLMNTHDAIPVEVVARKLSISQRYLEMNFKKSVGISPKTYSLILRFKRMEQQLKTVSVAQWKKMSFANEYHDQNHFIKDFKRFTGHTPSNYLVENLEMGRSYLIGR